MHYYGTYAIARAAGLKPKDAKVIAYSAQFVDDSTAANSQMREDGFFLLGVATAHHPSQTVIERLWHGCKNLISHKKIGNVEQSKVWVPFHFYPGNEGDTLSEKLICRKNSQLVNEMFDNHIKYTKEFLYILQLIGIASHVYMDTFSHYGFSGVSARNNKTISDSFAFKTNTKKHMKKLSKFNRKYKKEYPIKHWYNKELGRDAIEMISEALGHGAVGTFPDRPYLEWMFRYEENGKTSERNNPQTFLEGCENLYLKLKEFSTLYYSPEKLISVEFSQIKESIKELLSFDGEKKARVKKWKTAIKNNKLFDTQKEEFLHYSAKEWEKQKTKEFKKLKNSSEATNLPVYKFHQAADYHKHYTLETLLPKYGITINKKTSSYSLRTNSYHPTDSKETTQPDISV